MRVLLVGYPGSWTHEGGHRTQQGETAEALVRAGVHAELGDLEAALSGDHDVVHFFGDPRPLLVLGRPRGLLAVSPVHLPASVALGPVRSRPGRARDSARHAARAVRHPRDRARQRADFRARMEALSRAGLIVVNSSAEARLLAADARGPLPPVRVARSGVHPRFLAGSPEEGRRLLGEAGSEPFVLCVARVEPIKNQVTLARAMRSVPRRLVLVGAVLPGNEPYLRACRAQLPSLVHVPHVAHGDLPHVYAAADAHVLPSWFETTGLSTLEAVAAGTPAVASHGPCVAEYFGTSARLVDPGDGRALGAAVREALGAPRGRYRDLAERFSWDRTASELLAAYGSALAGSPQERGLERGAALVPAR